MRCIPATLFGGPAFGSGSFNFRHPVESCHHESTSALAGCAATALFFILLSTRASVLTARQEPTKPSGEPPVPKAERRDLPGPHRQQSETESKIRAAEATLEKMFAEYDLKPHPQLIVPDDPPPHEGAMIDYPHVIEPPDLVLVEVLEAFPGRPISGERLVRHDGTISLGFYGDVHVAGLTVKQAKVKIIQHLRKFLSDEVLGLFETRLGEAEQEPVGAKPPGVGVPIPVPPKDENPFDLEQEKPRPEPGKPRTIPSGYKVRPVSRDKEVRSHFGRPRAQAGIRLVGRTQEQVQSNPDESRQPVKIPLEVGGHVTISIEVQSGKKGEKEPVAEGRIDVRLGPPLSPEDSDRVFVDVTSYNSKNYYVLGDFNNPGRLPFTGRETVLDAVQFAGGLLPSAEPREIRLVRPGRGGKPDKVYKVDLDAIQDRGDVTTNYQIFPGDRLIVGRNEAVKQTMQADRLAAGMQTVVNSILQESFMARSLQLLDPKDHDMKLEQLVDFWIQEIKRPTGVLLDERTLREALIRRLQDKPEKR